MEKKRKLTPEELSALRSENGRRGAATRKLLGLNHGGRPKGSMNKTHWDPDPHTGISARTLDARFIARAAFLLDTSKTNVVRIMTCLFRAAFPGRVKLGAEDEAKLDKSAHIWAEELGAFAPKTDTPPAAPETDAPPVPPPVATEN